MGGYTSGASRATTAIATAVTVTVTVTVQVTDTVIVDNFTHYC